MSLSAEEIQLETELVGDKNSICIMDDKVLFISLVPKRFLELVTGVVPVILY